MCELLNIGRSSYYKWLKHEETEHEKENRELIELIKAIHYKYKGIFGYRRMTAWINRYHGYHVNHKRIKRLMNVLGIKATIRTKKTPYRYTTAQSEANNVLNRQFSATVPNQKWVTDVTEFKLNGSSQKYYLSAILDLYDLSIVAYQIGPKNDNNLVFSTFKEAFKKYPEAKPLVHSDRGYQYTSPNFKLILDRQDCTQSMSRVGCCIDNGPIENFWGQLKSEKYYLGNYQTVEALIEDIEEYIEFYNTKRLQRRFKNQTPSEVRNQALTSDNPEYYPIPINLTIEKYWKSLEAKKTVI